MVLEEQLKRAIRDVPDYPKPGIVFKDITPLLADPVLVASVTRAFADRFQHERLDAIVATEARGFIFGGMLARELGIRFIPVRKAGKLPYRTIQKSYALEYGQASVEMHEDAISPGWRVMVHDDLLATGGTAAASAKLVAQLGGDVVAFSFLINLAFLEGERSLERQFGLKPFYLVSY